MKKPVRFMVLGDFDTLIDIKRINGWSLVENPGEVFIQFKYLDKELVSVKYSKMNKFKRFIISSKLKKIANNMSFYKI